MADPWIVAIFPCVMDHVRRERKKERRGKWGERKEGREGEKEKKEGFLSIPGQLFYFSDGETETQKD